MTVIPTISNRQVRAEIQPTATSSVPAFKANEQEKDSFVKRPKESWVHKYREFLGSIAGWIAGDVIWQKTLKSKVENAKNMTSFKALALNIAFDTVVGYIAGKIALQFGKDKQA